MSYGFMAYAVDTNKLVEVCGSGDDELCRTICGRFKRELADLDNSFDYAIEGGCPTAEQAVRALIHGEELKGHGFMYAYAFKLMVEHFGDFLDNSSLYPTGTSWPDEVDEVLKAGGVKAISLAKFSYGSLPVKVPHPDDFPGFGHLTAEQVRTAKSELDGFMYDGDAEIAGAVRNLRSWVLDASSKNWGIVAFFH